MTKLDQDESRELRKMAKGLERNLTIFIDQHRGEGVAAAQLAELELLVDELQQAALHPNQTQIDAIAGDSFELVTWIFRDLDAHRRW
jgi:hypothetical protein